MVPKLIQDSECKSTSPMQSNKFQTSFLKAATKVGPMHGAWHQTLTFSISHDDQSFCPEPQNSWFPVTFTHNCQIWSHFRRLIIIKEKIYIARTQQHALSAWCKKETWTTCERQKEKSTATNKRQIQKKNKLTRPVIIVILQGKTSRQGAISEVTLCQYVILRKFIFLRRFIWWAAAR